MNPVDKILGNKTKKGHSCPGCGGYHDTEDDVSECCAIMMAGGINEYREFTR